MHVRTAVAAAAAVFAGVRALLLLLLLTCILQQQQQQLLLLLLLETARGPVAITVDTKKKITPQQCNFKKKPNVAFVALCKI